MPTLRAAPESRAATFHPRTRRVWPLLLPGGLALMAGLWLGLVRLGWELPVWARLATAAHGPLMVAGFLGTLIGVERAVALGRRWAFAAPVLSGVGALVLIAAPRSALGGCLLLAGAFALLAVAVRQARLWRGLPSTIMAAGVAALAVADALWLAGEPIHRFVLWWAAFPVLVVAGERLEMNRIAPAPPAARVVFAACIAAFLLGLLASLVWWDGGTRATGLAMAGLGAWLARYDLARRTMRSRGLPRYVAVCLLSGIGWLVGGGTLALVLGGTLPGPHYDAVLHSCFVGFVLPMIFGHAPIILPAVTGFPLPYRPFFYLPLALLNLSLLVRVGGDLVGWMPGRQFGGLLNVAAVLLFAAGAAVAAAGAGKRAAP